MLPTYATPLKLEIKSSDFYLIFVAIILSMAIISLFLLPINVWIKFLFSFVLCLFSVSLCLNSNERKTVIWKQGNKWEVIDKENYKASLLSNSLVFPWLTILNFKLETGRLRSVIIFPDSLDKEVFRQLRVRLKVSSGKIFKPEKL